MSARTSKATRETARSRSRGRGAARPAYPAREAARAVEVWGPVAGRVALGLVFAWFGYHELVQPRLWTGYVPVLPPASTVAVWLVLVHGWFLLVLAASLVFGILPRLAAGLGVLLMLEIVVSLSVTHGLSDVVLRDLGVLGLALTLAAQKQRRLVLTS